MATIKTFKISTSAADPSFTTPIKIHEPADKEKQQHLGLSTWGASQILAQQVHKIPVHLPTSVVTPVLEIGAGTGLVGLTAAVTWKTGVVLTDMEECVENLDANIRLNDAALETSKAGAIAGRLHWARPSELILHDGKPLPNIQKFRVILAADTVYAEEHSSQQVDVVCNWLEKSPQALFCIAYPMRVAYLDYIREIWALLEGRGFWSIDEGRAEIGDEWDDEKLIEWSVWQWSEEELKGESVR